MAKRRKKSLLTSVVLAPITIPAKMTKGILTAGAVIGVAGLGAIISSAKSSGKGRQGKRHKWY